MSAGNPADLLTGKRFEEFLEAVKGTFDRVIIDSPPLMGATEARILAATSDVTIFVLRMNRSHRKLGAMAIEELRRVGARLLGAIANDVPPNKNYPYVGPNGMAAGYDARYPLLSAAPAAPLANGHDNGAQSATENAAERGRSGAEDSSPPPLPAENFAIPGPG
jgi:Mrp family chromosome partitioning ATPase